LGSGATELVIICEMHTEPYFLLLFLSVRMSFQYEMRRLLGLCKMAELCLYVSYTFSSRDAWTNELSLHLHLLLKANELRITGS
jgi:hypothetical protein